MAVIPLARGRLELGLWSCGRLDTMVAGPMDMDEDKIDDNDDRNASHPAITLGRCGIRLFKCKPLVYKDSVDHASKEIAAPHKFWDHGRILSSDALNEFCQVPHGDASSLT